MSKIEVGQTYKFKDYISDEELASFNWDESKEQSIEGGIGYIIRFGREDNGVGLIKYALPEKEEKPSIINVAIGNSAYALSASYSSVAAISPPPVYNQWFNGETLEVVEAPTITIPENDYDTNYDDLAIFFELDDPEPRKPVEPQFNVLDASFWDNPTTRTGWPGVKTKKEKGLKEILVGHTYKFKDYISDEEFASFNWDESKAIDDGIFIGMFFGDDAGSDANIVFAKTIMGVEVSGVLEIINKNSTILCKNGAEKLSGSTGITFEPNVWYQSTTEATAFSIIPGPTITIPENAHNTNYNDLAIFFEKEII